MLGSFCLCEWNEQIPSGAQEEGGDCSVRSRALEDLCRGKLAFLTIARLLTGGVPARTHGNFGRCRGLWVTSSRMKPDRGVAGYCALHFDCDE